MNFTRINFQNRGGSNTGKPRISAANLSTLQDGIEEGITKAEAAATARVFSARKTVGQTVLAAGTILVFDEEEFDVGGWHDPATGRYTPLKTGYYRLGGGMRLQAVTNAKWARVALLKNGVAYKTLWSDFNGSGGSTDLIGSGTVVVFANGTTDYFEIRADHNDTVSRQAYGAAANQDTFFQGQFIGA